MVRMDKSNKVHMDMLSKQRGRMTCPQLWPDARYPSVEVIKLKEKLEELLKSF